MILIFGKADCSECALTMREFYNAKIDYEYKPLDFVMKNFENMGLYMFYAQKKEDLTLPLILIDEVNYTREEAFKKFDIKYEPIVCKKGVCKI